MPKLWVKQSGTWKQVNVLWVKKNGVWSSVAVGVVTQSGIGKQFYPDSVGTTTFTTYGTYSYTVPAGVTSVTARVVGAGGGGGGNNTSGNIAGGTGGGSGGYYNNVSINVTPGEVLTVVVGRGGYGGDWRFNSGSYSFNTETGRTDNPGTYNGGAGGSSAIVRSGTDLYRATGGGGGQANQGSPGAAGSPSGVAGSGTFDTGNCSIPVNEGVNALGLGSGGRGGQCYVGSAGSDGYVSITPVNANVVTFSTAGSTGTWTVPNGVTSIRLTMVGAGGYGQANVQGTPGPGGGSGAYFPNVAVSVTPGQVISYSVGLSGGSTAINPFQSDGTDTVFGSLIAGGGKGGHWRSPNTPYPSDERKGEGGIATGTGGVNGTAGNEGGSFGGNGAGAPSPYGTGGVGTGGAGGAASGFGAGGGGGGNNSAKGPGTSGFITITY